MLINVVPPSTSTKCPVVFAVLFENFGDEIAIPAGWSFLRQLLRRDDLPVPEAIHSLDKAAGINSLLEEVNFDLSTNLITCHFVDGWTEQWSIEAPSCITALENVILGVNESTFEIETEQQRVKDQEKERERRFSELSFRSKLKHKKKKSLFMAIVDSFSSVISLSSPSSSPLPSPPPTPIVENKPRSTISPRARRRLARSELVDTFRRYALGELVQRFPKGGYYSWVILSMLRRSNEAVKFLIENSQNWVDPHPETHYYPEDSEYFSITAASLPPTPDISDDESDYSYSDTDTDGSSLHTPSWPPPARRPSIQTPTRGYIPKRKDSISSTPRRFASAAAQIEYGRLMLEMDRLNRLLKYNDDRRAQEEAEIQHHLALLEARGKRRAWLNKDLKGGARTQIAAIEMALPFQSSPLALSSWTYEDSDDEDGSDLFLGQMNYNCSELKIKRTKPHRATGTRLFPVTEEPDEPAQGPQTRNIGNSPNEPQNLQLTIDDFDIDLEGGLYRHDLVEKNEQENDTDTRSALEVERPQNRPRMRTSSMYQQRIVTPVEPPLPSIPRSRSSTSPVSTPPMSCASSLFGDDNSSLDDTLSESSSELDNPPAYTEVDVTFNLNVGQLDAANFKQCTKFESSEFTLAMDLPLRVRMQDRSREGLSVCWENEE